jgi:CP family cyanate transporter-like MFS transporter
VSHSAVKSQQKYILKAMPLFFVGMTLRPLTTSVGPVLPEIRAEFGLSATAASLLSTLPILMFGFGAMLVPRLLNRVTPNRAVSVALVALAIGGTLRLVPTVAVLYLGTIVIGLGVAVGNVVPSIITRRDFPKNIGGVMGMIAGAISISAAIAALITYPLTEAIGSWRGALELWAILPLIAWVVWRFYRHTETVDATLTTPRDMRALFRNKLAWALVFYFGFQSMNYHSMNAWLPSILRDSGIDPTIAGKQLALLVLLGFPAGLLVPPLAAKFKSQVMLCVSFVIIFAIGLVGIYLFATTGWWPNGTWLWVSLLGIGLGSSFPLALTLVLLRSDSHETARDLGSFMQGGGYMISAIGPLTLGLLKDLTHTWGAAFIALAVALLIQLVSGIVISRPGVIKGTTKP